MSYAQAQCLTDRGDWRENIEEKVSSNASAKLTPLVDSLWIPSQKVDSLY